VRRGAGVGVGAGDGGSWAVVGAWAEDTGSETGVEDIGSEPEGSREVGGLRSLGRLSTWGISKNKRSRPLSSSSSSSSPSRPWGQTPNLVIQASLAGFRGRRDSAARAGHSQGHSQGL
jgi:hypothetical protein